MKTYEVWENKQVNDKWGATTNELVKVDTARVSISTKSTLNINKDMKYAEVTHMGLKENRNLKSNQVLCLDALYDGTTSGQTVGGYVKGGSALDINFLICPTTTPIAVTKQDNMRIFSPDVNQAADEWSMDYRRYHELWVLDSRKDSIYLCTKASS